MPWHGRSVPVTPSPPNCHADSSGGASTGTPPAPGQSLPGGARFHPHPRGGSGGAKAARLGGPDPRLPTGFIPVAQKLSEDVGQELSPVDVLTRHDSGLSSLLRDSALGGSEDGASAASTPRSTAAGGGPGQLFEGHSGLHHPQHQHPHAPLQPSRLSRRLESRAKDGGPTDPGPTAAALGRERQQVPASRRRPLIPTKSAKAVPTGESGVFTSLFRGVTKHRLTGRYEAHYWDASFKRETKVLGLARSWREWFLGLGLRVCVCVFPSRGRGPLGAWRRGAGDQGASYACEHAGSWRTHAGQAGLPGELHQ